MRDSNAVFLILVVGAGALLGILVSRRLITTRDVANLLLGVLLGYLLAKYVLPRSYLTMHNVPTHKCPLYDGPFVQRVSTESPPDSVPCAPADILIRTEMSVDFSQTLPRRHA